MKQYTHLTNVIQATKHKICYTEGSFSFSTRPPNGHGLHSSQDIYIYSGSNLMLSSTLVHKISHLQTEAFFNYFRQPSLQPINVHRTLDKNQTITKTVNLSFPDIQKPPTCCLFTPAYLPVLDALSPLENVFPSLFALSFEEAYEKVEVSLLAFSSLQILLTNS